MSHTKILIEELFRRSPIRRAARKSAEILAIKLETKNDQILAVFRHFRKIDLSSLDLCGIHNVDASRFGYEDGWFES